MDVQPSDIINTAKFWVHRLAPGLSYHDREELQQYLVLQLLVASKRFNSEKSSWNNHSAIAARGAVKDWFARDYFRRDHLHNEDEETDYGYEPDQSYLYVREFADNFQGKRKLLVLCLALGLNDSEISRVLSVPLIQVRNMRLDLLRHSLQQN